MLFQTAAIHKARHVHNYVPQQTKRETSFYEFYNNIFEGVIADTPALLEECFRLRYQVYCVEYDWLNGSNLYSKNQIERDVYDDHSAHGLLRHRETGLFIGTVRLILHRGNSTEGMFPVHALCAQNNFEIPRLTPAHHMAEISRFCIPKKIRQHVTELLRQADIGCDAAVLNQARIIPAMSLGLIRMLVLMAKQNNIRQWCAEMEPFLITHLAKMGIHFESVGPLIEFHGKRQVCHKLLDEWLDRIAQEQPEVWDIVTDKGRYCP